MKVDQAIEFLMDEGGPTLRYLTALQLIGDRKLAGQLRRGWRDDLVGHWLGELKLDLPLHGASDDTFETVTGKLFELGAHRDVLPLARPMSHYLKRLEHEPRNMLDNLFQVIIASAAVRLGFDVSRYASCRLSALHRAIRDFDFDIYRKRGSYRLPKRYKNYPVVSERFAHDGVFMLPYVHDLYLLSNVDLGRSDRRKYLDVVRYVLDDRYQRLPHGFGYVEEELRGKPRWLVVGWKAGFDGSLIRMELNAALPRGLRVKPDLRSYEEEVGWSFPKQWLTEKSPGYWVNGERMALTSGIRRKRELKLESTFRAARLLRQFH